jgi:hypothetical protein
MSSEKYINARSKLMNDKQCQIMMQLFMKGINHDGHSWNKFGDIEDAVADIVAAGKIDTGMLNPKESADATILNLSNWDYEINGSFSIDAQVGAALVAEYTKLKMENDHLKKHIAANKFLNGGSL